MDKLLLIDGHSILNRAFYGLPELTDSKGRHTNAVLGFLNIMLKIMDEEKPTHLFVAFDVHEPTFRHKMYAEYKGTRKGMPEELREQVPLIKEVLHSMNVKTIEKGGYEADDIIGTMSRNGERSGYQVVIVSGDRDLLQLATDKILVRIPKTKKGQTVIENYYADGVKELYGVTPTEFIDLKGLMGDASDNIKGVPGIGEKTAVKLITEYHSIENAYEHIDEIKQNKIKENLREYYDQAIFSRLLATIKLDCKLDVSVEDGRIGKLYNDNSYKLFKELEFKQLLKNFDEDTEPERPLEYIVANDLSDPKAVLCELREASFVGLHVIYENGVFCGFSAALSSKNYVFLAEGALSADQLIEEFTDILRSTKTAVIDLKTTLHAIHAGRSDSFDCFDLQIAAYLLNPLKDSYTYDDIARDYLSRLLPSKKELVGKDVITPINIRTDNFLKAFVYEARTAFDAEESLNEALLREGLKKLYDTIELPCVYTLYHMESAGIKVNRTALSEYSKMLSLEIEKLEKNIYEAAGEEFNINSPKQLGVILFEKMGITGGKKTKTGYSTSADVLEKLKPDYPIVNDILSYRTYTKLKSTYADGLCQYISGDDRIYGTFNQTITATGRLSSTEPNLQNIPMRIELGRKIRKAFIPEEGYTFVDADYSQIELRVLTHMSDDPVLIEAYKNDRDIHASTASSVFEVPLSEVTPLMRRKAKVVNFGIIYGQSAFGLSEELNISRTEAKEYIEKYYKTFPKIKECLNAQVEAAKKDGAVYTLWHRKRPVPEIASSNFMQRSFGERIAMNSPIQGTAADIIKLAMVKVDNALIEKNMKSRLVLQIHDELLIEAYDEEKDEVMKLLKNTMEQVAELKVPLIVDMHEGKDWYEAK